MNQHQSTEHGLQDSIYQIRASHFEEDVISSGSVEAFGDVVAGIRGTHFADLQSGRFIGAGGLIGRGDMSLLHYDTTALTFRFPDANYINYERALNGSVTLAHDDTQLTSKDGIATVSRHGTFEVNFQPEDQTLRGLAISLSVEALDNFLSAAGEPRAGDVKYVVVEGSGPKGPDAALLSLCLHALAHFDRYSHLTETRPGRLVEALLTETFVQFLREIGALELQDTRNDSWAAAVKRAEEYMRANLSEPITIADVAAATGVNLRSLQAAFRTHGDTTPRQFLTSLRLEQARALLTTNGHSGVTEIALSCGLMHPGRFAQAYKKKFGELPSETALRSRNRRF